MGDVGVTKTFRNQDFYSLTNERAGLVAEHLFGRRIGENEPAFRISYQHRFRGGLQQPFQALSSKYVVDGGSPLKRGEIRTEFYDEMRKRLAKDKSEMAGAITKNRARPEPRAALHGA
jgi:hypothetical protein